MHPKVFGCNQKPLILIFLSVTLNVSQLASIKFSTASLQKVFT
jgi:hypothetical protein